MVGNRPGGGGRTPVRHPDDLLRVVVGTITLVASGAGPLAGSRDVSR
jgi:hypothetical protein